MYQSDRTFGERVQFVVDIENTLYYTARINFDFTGSKNIKIKGEANSLYKEDTIQPLDKQRVVTLNLKKGWAISCTIKYQLDVPEKHVVENLLRPEMDKVKHEISKAKKEAQNGFDCYSSHFEETFEYLTKADLNFVDMFFKPEDVSAKVKLRKRSLTTKTY